MNLTELKIKLLDEIAMNLQEKVLEHKAAILSAKESRDSDTKSSAGDKYETGREMMQMEISKAEAQLSKTLRSLHETEQLRSVEPSSKVEYGSLIETNRGLYFFGVSLGKVQTKAKVIYALSMASPLGKACIHKCINDSFTFNDNLFTIKAIC